MRASAPARSDSTILVILKQRSIARKSTNVGSARSRRTGQSNVANSNHLALMIALEPLKITTRVLVALKRPEGIIGRLTAADARNVSGRRMARNVRHTITHSYIKQQPLASQHQLHLTALE